MANEVTITLKSTLFFQKCLNYCMVYSQRLKQIQNKFKVSLRNRRGQLRKVFIVNVRGPNEIPENEVPDLGQTVNIV